MFELRIARSYLIPRKKSLSTSLVFLLSVLVISLVVWLALVFLSITTGIERNWLKKLTSLYAPLRITPTDHYYNSTYFRADALSAASNYTLKSIGEKAEALQTNPYSPERDAHVEFRSDPQSDPVKELYSLLTELGFPYQDYELAGGLLRIHLTEAKTAITQMSYFFSLTENNPELASLLLAPKEGLIVDGHCQLPQLPFVESILLPKSYRDLGVRVGDQGSIQFTAMGAASAQEQSIPMQVVGFYDPGLFSLGGRCVISSSSLTRTIRAASQTFSPDGTPSNGIFVWCTPQEADHIKEQIKQKLAQTGLAPFWKITTYKEFEFSKELFQQFHSDRTLFLFLAIVILMVACCNIISLLILLVQDKKREIAILAAMGASKYSLAIIFGFCGLAVGMTSTLLGTVAALFSLHHLDVIVQFLSTIQGHAAFQPAFFGNTLPNELSGEAILLIFLATSLLSLLAGLIPALRAARIQPAVALRQE